MTWQDNVRDRGCFVHEARQTHNERYVRHGGRKFVGFGHRKDRIRVVDDEHFDLTATGCLGQTHHVAETCLAAARDGTRRLWIEQHPPCSTNVAGKVVESVDRD